MDHLSLRGSFVTRVTNYVDCLGARDICAHDRELLSLLAFLLRKLELGLSEDMRSLPAEGVVPLSSLRSHPRSWLEAGLKNKFPYSEPGNESRRSEVLFFGMRPSSYPGEWRSSLIP